MSASQNLQAFQYAVLVRLAPGVDWELHTIHGRDEDAAAEKERLLESIWAMEQPDPEVRIVRWEPAD